MLPRVTSIRLVCITTPQLNFSFLDKNVLSGGNYRYTLIPMIGLDEQTPVNVTVACAFNGIIVSDSTGDFIASLNMDYKFKRNTPVSYVQPLSSKYPHTVRNSLANYSTGSVDGIFTEYGVDCTPNISTMKSYKDSAMEMLSNGLVKTLRTFDGHGWLISVDSDISRNTDKFINSDTIAFNWTEVGVFPTTGVIML